MTQLILGMVYVFFLAFFTNPIQDGQKTIKNICQRVLGNYVSTATGILVHEAGHYYAAKALGLSVNHICFGQNKSCTPEDTYFCLGDVCVANFRRPDLGCVSFNDDYTKVLSPMQQAVMLAAGPIAGLLAALCLMHVSKSTLNNPQVALMQLWNLLPGSKTSDGGKLLNLFSAATGIASLACIKNFEPNCYPLELAMYLTNKFYWLAFIYVSFPNKEYKYMSLREWNKIKETPQRYEPETTGRSWRSKEEIKRYFRETFFNKMFIAGINMLSFLIKDKLRLPLYMRFDGIHSWDRYRLIARKAIIYAPREAPKAETEPITQQAPHTPMTRLRGRLTGAQLNPGLK